MYNKLSNRKYVGKLNYGISYLTYLISKIKY